MPELSEIRLWQLLSPALPIGGYSYSQGLETAVSQGWVTTVDSAADWILEVGGRSLPKLELPYLRELRRHLDQPESFQALNLSLLAHRETDELRAEDRRQGRALGVWLAGMDGGYQPPAHPLSLAGAFAGACAAFDVDESSMLSGFGWLWFENQVAAATKLVPLGQTDSQRLLLRCGERLERLVVQANAVTLDQAGASMPGVVLASALHETAYSRHYRS